MSGVDYEAMRHFADSWGLIFLLGVFAAGIAWAFRPGASYRDHREIPFKYDDDAGGTSHDHR
jgi:cytochrome c oxidase cbb3-type subunit 4